MRFAAREILFFSAMVGLLAAAYFLVFTKANQKRDELLARLAERQKTLNDVRATTAGIDDFGHKISELQQAIEFFEKKLPPETEMDEILAETTRKAEENQLTIKTFKPLKVERSPGYNELPIEITLLGDFDNFYEFLLQVERMPRQTRIGKMKIERIDAQDGQTKSNMTFSIFFEPDAKPESSTSTVTTTATTKTSTAGATKTASAQ
jgi:type IV pilus assembly protein PilO